MSKHYQHTQIGYLIIIAVSIALSFITYRMVVNGFSLKPFIVLITLGAILVLFASLTVVIENDVLKIWFGPGIIRKRFYLKGIESFQTVNNPWYYGWGIRLLSQGWLYNVSGFYAVEIRMKTGKTYRIGTDVPNDLEKAIRQSIERMAK